MTALDAHRHLHYFLALDFVHFVLKIFENMVFGFVSSKKKLGIFPLKFWTEGNVFLVFSVLDVHFVKRF